MSFYSIAPFIKEHYPDYFSLETYPADKCAPVHKVNGEWGIFSNFARTPLIVDGLMFKSAEQLFQLMKFRTVEPLSAVYAANNPKMTAKKWEKTCRRPDWGCMVVDAIKYCLQTKYEQNDMFRSALEESRGLFIVEDQTSFPKRYADTWGVKRRTRHTRAPIFSADF